MTRGQWKIAAFSGGVAALLIASGVQGAPFAGDRRLEIRVNSSAPYGYRALAPVVLEGATGARIHGVFCRTDLVTPVGPGLVRVERMDPGGRVATVAFGRLSRQLTGRQTGCGFFDISTDWQLGATDALRVSAPATPG